MKTRATRIFFLVLTLGGGSAIGTLTGPGEWYAQLVKPSFNPPSWIFAPAWTVLYILIAEAGYRTWMRNRKSAAMKLWFAQLLLNFAWSPVFFGVHRIGAALVVILLLLSTSAAFVFSVRKQDKTAALLFVPYLAWVTFAGALNTQLLRLNG